MKSTHVIMHTVSVLFFNERQPVILPGLDHQPDATHCVRHFETRFLLNCPRIQRLSLGIFYSEVCAYTSQ